MKKIIVLLVLFCSIQPAHAWSLRTHVFIAQQVLNDVLDDGMLTLAGKKYKVPDSIYVALKSHPDKFRMGSLGPDVFPDFIVGQVTTHPGIPQGWKTDDWLKYIMSRAKTREERAFAYGYVVHASSDIFAHTYVNMFAGDVFNLTNKERTVELRHFMLEKFIEGYTPPIKDVNGALVNLNTSLSSPLSFLVSTLILNKDVHAQYKLKGVNDPSRHLITMYNIHKNAVSFTERITALIKLVEIFTGERRLDRNSRVELRDYFIKSKEDMKDKVKALKEKLKKPNADIEKGKQDVRAEENELSSFQALEKENEKIILDAEAEINESVALQMNLQSVVKLLESWENNMVSSAQLYIKASDTAGIIMLTGGDKAASAYSNWANCHAWSFAAIPPVIPATWCDFKNYMEEVKQRLEAELPPRIQRFVATYKNLKKYLLDELKPLLVDKTEWFVRDIAGQDAESVQLAYYMKWTKEISKEKLDEIYRKDSSGKSLLMFENVSNYVMADMDVIDSRYFNPETFGPISNSITLSRLALLDPAGLNEVIKDNNAGKSESFLYGSPVYPKYSGNYTLLFDAVTSIDGNHQWQPYPLPYPRRSSVAQNDSFGYNYYDHPELKKGFKLWVDPVLRKNVFLKLINPKSSLAKFSNDGH